MSTYRLGSPVPHAPSRSTVLARPPGQPVEPPVRWTEPPYRSCDLRPRARRGCGHRRRRAAGLRLRRAERAPRRPDRRRPDPRRRGQPTAGRARREPRGTRTPVRAAEVAHGAPGRARAGPRRDPELPNVRRLRRYGFDHPGAGACPRACAVGHPEARAGARPRAVGQPGARPRAVGHPEARAGARPRAVGHREARPRAGPGRGAEARPRTGRRDDRVGLVGDGLWRRELRAGVHPRRQSAQAGDRPLLPPRRAVLANGEDRNQPSGHLLRAAPAGGRQRDPRREAPRVLRRHPASDLLDLQARARGRHGARCVHSAQYKAAWRHIAKIADASGKPLRATLILMGWTAKPQSGRNFADFYPGADVIDVLAWDCYAWGPNDTPASVYGAARSLSQQAGKPWAVAETGVGSKYFTNQADRRAKGPRKARRVPKPKPPPGIVPHLSHHPG